MKAGAAINAMFAGMALAATNPMPYFASDTGGTASRKKATDMAKQKRKAKLAAQSKRRNRK